LRELLRCGSAAEVDWLRHEEPSQRYGPGQLIYREGGRPAGLHCLHAGRVKLTKTSGDGKEQIIRLAGGGEVLGFRSLLAGTTHAVSAVAMSDCTVCLLPRALFLEQVRTNPAVGAALLRLLAQGLGEAAERLLHLAYKPVRERLAEALLLLLRTYGHSVAGTAEGDHDDEPHPFAIAITREDLAALMGASKETSTRMLAEFKHEGLVGTRGSTITLLAPERLRQLATRYELVGGASS